MAEILEKLDFNKNGDSLLLPTYRYGDISANSTAELVADLAEEISRIYGYDELRASAEIMRGGRSKEQKFMLKIHETLLSGGFYETYTYSFIPPKHFDKLNLPEDSKLRDYIELINPIGEDMSVLRTNLLSSTLATIAHNYANRNESGYFYDSAKIYFKNNQNIKGDIKGKSAAIEKNMLSLGFYDTADKSADFYTLKGAVENILNAAGVKFKLSSDIAGHELASAYHPGRSAVILAENGEKVYGILGEVHPLVLENFEIGARSYAAEINIDMLFENASEDKIYTPLPKYPATTRDLALVCDDDLESAEIHDIIKKESGKILESAKIFDVYKGDKIGADKKSVAFALTFRDSERTLNDEEVNAVTAKILTSLANIGVELRR
jgi:phenylalanyl-tRNA synthetase beta chain